MQNKTNSVSFLAIIRTFTFFIFPSIPALFLISGCATGSSRSLTEIQATAVEQLRADQNAPKGIISDSMTIGSINLLPTSVIEQIVSAQQTKTNKNDLAILIQSLMCDGKSARYSPTYRLELIIPKSPEGLPLNLATKAKQLVIETSRNRAKDFFNLASTSIGSILHQDISKNANSPPVAIGSEFKSYKKLILDNPGGAAFWNGRYHEVPPSLHIPYVNSKDRNDVKQYYSALPHVPESIGVVRNSIKDAGYQPDYALGLVDGKTNTIMLVPRVAQAVKVDWKLNNVGSWHYNPPTHELKQNFKPKFYFYEISDTGWKLIDNTIVYPMRATHMDDLVFIKNLFTFALPKDLATKFSNQKEESSNISEDFGYQFDNDKSEYTFSPELAIRNSAKQWNEILRSQTEVKEAVISANIISYEVKLDLGLFCTFGVSKTDLQSR